MPPLIRKILMWLIVIFFIWFILSNPAKAGSDGQSVIHGLKSAGNSLSTFFANL